MKSEKISDFTIYRLSIYLRCLDHLVATGVTTTSSQALAEQFQLNSAQIRKDLTAFGEFGIRGVGYNVVELRAHLRKILGLFQVHKVGIVGAGHLGMALADYQGFQPTPFQVVALFDHQAQEKEIRSASGIPLYPIKDFKTVVARENITIGVLCVPPDEAQEMTALMVQSGITAILNFAPVRLNIESGIKVKTMDLSMSFESLSYFLTNQQPSGIAKARAASAQEGT
jgi:redox-sensing transcriptional repressor